MAKPGEKFKTYKNVFDNFTERNIFKLISEGYFESLQSPISIGKEANIFSAITKDNKNVILKIYRLETCDFNRMYDYLRLDPRYEYMKRSKRKIIFVWTQREYRNLIKAREAGVTVPTPINFMHNILVEEFIGNMDSRNKRADAAPKVKDLYPEDRKKFFEKVIKNMRKLYKAELVHADLSEFNILNHNEEPIFIDFGQCTSLKDSMAEEYLERDIRNICRFFKKVGLSDKVCDEGKVKERITNS